VELEGDGLLVLLETAGKSGKYAALSHCWGTGNMPPFTGSQNIPIGHYYYERFKTPLQLLASSLFSTFGSVSAT
jgi:hypothetical protein